MKGRTSKGVSSIVAAIMVFFIAIIILGYLGLTWKWGEGLTTKATIQLDIYGMENSLQAAEMYMQTALDYSVYQALYDTAQRGGFCGIPEGVSETIDGKYYAYWQSSLNSEAEVPSDDTILQSIDSCAETNINIYAAEGCMFMSNYNVIIPQLGLQVEATDGYGSITFSAQSSDSMLITKSDPEQSRTITLKKGLSMESSYETEYFDLISMGREKLAEHEPSFLGPLQTELDMWPLSYTREYHGTESAPDVTFDQVFSDAVLHSETLPEQARTQASMDDAENYLEGLFAESTPELNFQDLEEGYLTEFEAAKVDVEIRPVCQIEKDDIEKKTTGTCDFGYQAEVAVKVTVTKTDGEELPVYDAYDGEQIAFRPLSMVFLIGESYSIGASGA